MNPDMNKVEAFAGQVVTDIAAAFSGVMTKKFPESVFFGFDSHPESIEIARQRSREEGVQANTHFFVSTAKSYTEDGFDLICFVDCLHDMGDPVGVGEIPLNIVLDCRVA